MVIGGERSRVKGESQERSKLKGEMGKGKRAEDGRRFMRKPSPLRHRFSATLAIDHIGPAE